MRMIFQVMRTCFALLDLEHSIALWATEWFSHHIFDYNGMLILTKFLISLFAWSIFLAFLMLSGAMFHNLAVWLTKLAEP